MNGKDAGENNAAGVEKLIFADFAASMPVHIVGKRDEEPFYKHQYQRVFP